MLSLRSQIDRMATDLPLNIFTAKNRLNAKILVKVSPPDWSTETLLIHMVTKTGAQTVFIVTKDALTTFKTVEENRIYDFEVPGRCVKKADISIKHGVAATMEVRIAYPIKFYLAVEGWPTLLQYVIIPFVNLPQKEEGSWVDVLAVVAKFITKPETEKRAERAARGGLAGRPGQQATRSVRKRVIEICSGTFHETLELLGRHADLPIKESDRIALKGCKISKWHGKYKLSTGFLTVVEINPPVSSLLPKVATDDLGGTTKKAMSSGFELTSMTVTQAIDTQMQWKQSLQQGEGDTEPRQVKIVGRVAQFDETLFAESPFYGTDEEPLMRLRVKVLGEGRGLSGVTLWDDAVRVIFQTDGKTFYGLWEKCIDAEGRHDLLDELNSCIDRDFQFIGSMKTWSPSNANSSQSKMPSYWINTDINEAIPADTTGDTH